MSEKYTYKDVIIDPKDPRVEIGKEYYAATSISSTLRAANEGKESILVKLDSVNREPTRTLITSKPFTVSYKQGNGGDTDFIIRKKEPSYEERQAEWVKANNIKVGDKVKVIRKAVKDYENGWGSTCNVHVMDSAVDKVFKIVNSHYRKGILLRIGIDDYWFPYFVLEKVEEPEFKVGDFVKEKETGLVGVITRKTEEGFSVYQNNPNAVLLFEASELEPAKAKIKPFDLNDDKDRAMLRGAWIRFKDDIFREYQVFAIDETEITICDDGDLIGINMKNLLEKCFFLGDSPCGIVMEDEE